MEREQNLIFTWMNLMDYRYGPLAEDNEIINCIMWFVLISRKEKQNRKKNRRIKWRSYHMWVSFAMQSHIGDDSSSAKWNVKRMHCVDILKPSICYHCISLAIESFKWSSVMHSAHTILGKLITSDQYSNCRKMVVPFFVVNGSSVHCEWIVLLTASNSLSFYDWPPLQSPLIDLSFQ